MTIESPSGKPSILATINPVRGLSLLVMCEPARYFTTIDDCRRYMHVHDKHPFGLDVPSSEKGVPRPKIRMVNAIPTDMGVEAFLACIRHCAGYADGERVTMLHIISVPASVAKPSDKFVFFEIRSGPDIFISSETTDFSGAGDAARQELEDAFTVISQIYGLQIKRVLLREPVDSFSFVETVEA